MAHINEDRMPSHLQFLRRLIENHEPLKYWPKLMLFDFQCSNRNWTSWLVHLEASTGRIFQALNISSFICRPGLKRNINHLPFFFEVRPLPLENSFLFCQPSLARWKITSHLPVRPGPAHWKNNLLFAAVIFYCTGFGPGPGPCRSLKQIYRWEIQSC